MLFIDGNDLEDGGRSSGVGNKDLLDDALESVSGKGNWGKSEGTGFVGSKDGTHLTWEERSNMWALMQVGG